MATKSSDKSSVKKPARAAKAPAPSKGSKPAAKAKATAAKATAKAKAPDKTAEKGIAKGPAKAADKLDGKGAGKGRKTRNDGSASAQLPLVAVELVPAPVVELSDEEKALVAMYGDDMSTPAAAHGEFKDQRTADEDRPMMPEITARDERNKRWEGQRGGRPEGGGGAGRDGRRQRRDRGRDRDRGGRGDRPAGEARPTGAARPAGEGRPADGGNGNRDARPPRDNGSRQMPTPRPEQAPVAPLAQLAQLAPLAFDGGMHRVGTTLGDGAAAVFAQLRGTQPMPVKQLAAMMRKRGLIETDPEVVWPALKSALLADERSYRALGLRPRLVYRGRDLFGPGVVTQAVTGPAEAALACALSGVASATHAALAQRVAAASGQAFERLIDAHLTATGYRDLTWLKRIDGISYGTALPPQGDRSIMISARSGANPVDRRGVGELRVGVDAKGLLYGLLLAASALSPEAERELERPGRSIQVVAGDGLITALVNAGVGVVTASAPVRYVDDQLLDELLNG